MLAQRGLFERKPERGRAVGWELVPRRGLCSADCARLCPLCPFSVSPSPKLSIHPTKKSNPQAELFTVFYESLKGRRKEKEKGWIWEHRGGGLLQRRREERGGERKKAGMRESPKRCQAPKKGLLGVGEGACQSPTEKEQRAEQEGRGKLKCKWTLVLLAETAKTAQRDAWARPRFWGVGRLRRSC